MSHSSHIFHQSTICFWKNIIWWKSNWSLILRRMANWDNFTMCWLKDNILCLLHTVRIFIIKIKTPLFPSFCITQNRAVCLDHTCSVTVWIFTTILKIYGYTFSGAQGVSLRMNVMRKCEGWQLTFQTGALLFGNGHDAMANYDLAQCNGLSENFK